MQYMIIIWIAALIAFIVIELLTFNLISVWFAFGAFVASLAYAMGFSVSVQAMCFVIFSGIAIAALRPFLKEYVLPYQTRTNADRVLDMIGIVREEIDNLNGQGAVYVDGKLWTARSSENVLINAGEKVIINRIEGVKLFVTRMTEAEAQNAPNAGIPNSREN